MPHEGCWCCTRRLQACLRGWENPVSLVIRCQNLPLSSVILYQTPEEKRLLDMEDFHYLNRPERGNCGEEEIFLQVLVQSRPSRFRQRQTIREGQASASADHLSSRFWALADHLSKSQILSFHILLQKYMSWFHPPVGYRLLWQCLSVYVPREVSTDKVDSADLKCYII